MQAAAAQVFYERKCSALRAMHGRGIQFPTVRSLLVYVSARDARATKLYRTNHPGAPMSLAVSRGLLPTLREGGAGDGTRVRWVTGALCEWDALSADARVRQVQRALNGSETNPKTKKAPGARVAE